MPMCSNHCIKCAKLLESGSPSTTRNLPTTARKNPACQVRSAGRKRQKLCFRTVSQAGTLTAGFGFAGRNVSCRAFHNIALLDHFADATRTTCNEGNFSGYVEQVLHWVTLAAGLPNCRSQISGSEEALFRHRLIAVSLVVLLVANWRLHELVGYPALSIIT